MKRSIAFLKPMTAAIAVAVSQMLMAGNVCTWQGGSGKFSDATNWDVAPISGNGDTLVFDTADGAAITVENDIADDFDVAMLSFANKDRTLGDCGKITFTGRRLYVSGGAATATLVFKPDASGITPIEVVGRLVVTEQARLEVDLSNCNLTATGKLQLLAFGEKVGAFAPENVEFTGSPRTPYLRVTDDGLWVGYRNGTMVIFK